MTGSFVLYNSQLDIISDFEDKDRLSIYDGITAYQTRGEIIDMTPAAKVAFKFIKNQFDIDKKKYEETVERLRANGRKGGLARGNKNLAVVSKVEQNEINIAEASNEEKKEQKIAIANFAKHNDNENENVNVYENENENENENVLSHNVEKKEITSKEREILENYVKRNNLAKKNVSAYVRKLIDNGDYEPILEKEKATLAQKSKPKDVLIQEKLASIVDKRSCARVLYEYYSVGDFPPPEFDEVGEKYGLTCYDDMYDYSVEISKNSS